MTTPTKRDSPTVVVFAPIGRDGPASAGDLAREAGLFLEAGVDGFFTDNPREGVAARDAFLAARAAGR